MLVRHLLADAAAGGGDLLGVADRVEVEGVPADGSGRTGGVDAGEPAGPVVARLLDEVAGGQGGRGAAPGGVVVEGPGVAGGGELLDLVVGVVVGGDRGAVGEGPGGDVAVGVVAVVEDPVATLDVLDPAVGVVAVGLAGVS
jgi:hypothetical protein